MLVSLLTLGCPEQLSGGYLYHCRLAELAGDHDAEVDALPRWSHTAATLFAALKELTASAR